MKSLTLIIISLTLGIILFSCNTTDPSEAENKICVFKIGKVCTDGTLKGCEPPKKLIGCDDKLNAYKYDLNKYIIEDCTC